MEEYRKKTSGSRNSSSSGRFDVEEQKTCSSPIFFVTNWYVCNTLCECITFRVLFMNIEFLWYGMVWFGVFTLLKFHKTKFCNVELYHVYWTNQMTEKKLVDHKN